MTKQTRRIWHVERPGSLQRVKLMETDVEAAVADTEVTVKVKSIGLNFADIFAIKGLYSATPKGGFTPGLEFSGVVSVSESPDLPLGTRVMGVTRFGGYADTITIDKDYVLPIPEEWSFQEGAAFPVQALTAYYGLVVLGDVQRGQKVLVHSAAGGVGIWAIRIAKHYGADVIGTVGDESKLEILSQEKCDVALVRGEDFHKTYTTAMGETQVDLVMECIGGQVFKDSYKVLKKMGRLITYGSASFTQHRTGVNFLSLTARYLRRPKVDPLKLTTENKSVMGFNLIYLFEQKKLFQGYMKSLADMDLPRPLIGKVFGFEDLHNGLSFFQSGSSVGKVILDV